MNSRKSIAAGGKKKVAETQGKMVATFLKGLSGQSTEKDIAKVLSMISDAVQKEDAPMISKICEAMVRVAGTDAGFFVFYRGGALEFLPAVLENMDGVELEIRIAYNALVQQAANWIAGVDQIEFFQLPQILELANKFAADYRSVALSSVATLDRFSLQMAVHRKAILQAGGLHLLHRILSAHRSPEFCQETLVLVFHVCDVPMEAVKPKVLAELSMINTVVETLNQAPVNMRLQIAGLKLLAMWQNWDDKKIDKAMRDAKAPEAYRNAFDALSKAGFSQAASWLECIGGAAFEEKERTAKGNRSQRSNKSDPNSQGDKDGD